MGTTLGQLINKVIENLSPDLVDKVNTSVLKQIGTHPGTVLNPQIDIENTLESIRIYDSHDIPSPMYAEQVISLKWLATLDKVRVSKTNSLEITF